MRSLRARLLVSVLAIAALGLLALGAIVYAEQRSFLNDRLDDQVRRAPMAMGRLLGEQGIGPAHPPPGPGPRGGGPPGRGPGGPPEDRPEGFLPPGTYGERRDASGVVLGGIVVGFADDDAPAPELPADLPVDEIASIAGYRVLAVPGQGPEGGLTVVALPTTEVDETLDRLLLVEALVILGILLVLGFAAWAVVRVGLRPLDRIGATAGRIAGGDLSHRVEETDARTEVGRLGLALNAMLDRLEGAFRERQASEDRLRQFLADASHELRTPLSSIRGYAELYRMGATRADETEVERSMGRIESEAARMGVLVEDLLTLARLDEIADAPHVDVDVASLVRDAVDDARAAAPDREITVEAQAAAVSGDAHQLRQVLANLLRNALVHTPPGTPIEVAARRGDGQVLLEVRDHGPGLPADDAAVIFERFWRAEAGRERGRDGAGLGLAIVAGIIDAHGGTVAARNAEGGGAAFTVTLPAR